MTNRSPRRLVLASANPDKAAEIAEILSEVPGLVLLPRPASVPEVVEDGATLVDNARLKAVAIMEATGEPAVADDTGLEVTALHGAPGVYSARFAGDDATYADNVDKLIAELAAAGAMEPSLRSARFRTVALVAFPGGDELAAEGEVLGSIATAPAGANGFGYDPLFIPEGGGGRTFAQMSPTEKHGLSHRGRAFRSLADKLREYRE
ncbi:MAG TPA: RdgB/HAM1 family non-canonical purine NTP pyrophosphatase [Acidimicrobiales bacterium]|nr:RdgB/HAM1 family non-canonical purine NTP pyrophosphatase [Acidimicrobiales bacterium]